MLLIPVILTTTALVIYLVFRKTVFPLLQRSRIHRRLAKEGTEAGAVLLNMEQTGTFLNGKPQIKLQLQVHALTGRNFVSEAFEVLSVTDQSQLHIGGTLNVKYNPANTKEVMVLRKDPDRSPVTGRS